MEDSYSVDYSSNDNGISSVARKWENLLESSSAAPILRRIPEGTLRVDPEISPPVPILGDSDSGSREISTALQEEENADKDK